MRRRSFAGLRGRSRWDLLRLYAQSAVRGVTGRARFRDVRAFLLFIGYPRSGHSVVGSLLDAHPDAVVAHELDALGFMERGFVRAQLFDLIVANAQEFTQRGREWTGYQYAVPGQWQGRSRAIQVIGDKKGCRTTRRIMHDPRLLDDLRELVRVPLRIVHVVRNPFDIIATRHRKKPHQPFGKMVDLHFKLCEGVRTIRDLARPGELLDVRHENLIADPAGTLTDVLAFLDLVPEPDYVQAAAGVVFPAPNRARDRIEWDAAHVADIARRTAEYEFLSGYVFDE